MIVWNMLIWCITYHWSMHYRYIYSCYALIYYFGFPTEHSSSPLPIFFSFSRTIRRSILRQLTPDLLQLSSSRVADRFTALHLVWRVWPFILIDTYRFYFSVSCFRHIGDCPTCVGLRLFILYAVFHFSHFFIRVCFP